MRKISMTLHSFSKNERKAFKKYLASPFFNSRSDVIRLYDYWLEQEEADMQQERAFAATYPGESYTIPKMRMVMTCLQQMAEGYLAQKEWPQGPASKERQLMQAYRKRGMNAHFISALRDAQGKLNSQPLRNTDYYTAQITLNWEQSRLEWGVNPTTASHLKAVSAAADYVWVAQKLRHLCLLKNQENLVKTKNDLLLGAEALEIAEKHELFHEPLVGIWYHCWHMQESQEAGDHFRLFKNMLLQFSHYFGEEEVRDLHLFAINFCIRGVNAGNKHFFYEIMDFYKEGLAKRYLFENGVLSRFTYHNIVAAGLQTLEYDWVEQFIGQYKNDLERTYRDSSFSFNMARLEYSRGQYDKALLLLQHSNYYDPLLNLAARTISLKIYYETKSFDLLESHLDALQNYIRRKSILGYHRNNYRNLVQYVRKMVTVNPFDKAGVEQLRQKIKEEEVLTEKEWILKQFNV